MAKTKFLDEIRAQKPDWLRAQIKERYTRLRTLRFELGFGNVTHLNELRRLKQELAQLWTILGQSVTKQ